MVTSRALEVDSATGVAVRFELVGPGGRSLAFVIDWHIRAALALCWYVAAALLHNLPAGRASLAAPLEPGASWFLVVLTPAAALYLLYHPILELAMRGRTPGKRLAGMRLVTRSGATPGYGALLLRNLFRLIDSLPAFYGVGLTATLLTRDHVRIGDLAAGTVLVYDRPYAAPADAPAVDPERAALAGELLERWNSLDPDHRRRLADRLLDAPAPDAQPTAGSDAGRREALRVLAGAAQR
jgi:uncharacterized RDD family membrane protein YckC